MAEMAAETELAVAAWSHVRADAEEVDEARESVDARLRVVLVLIFLPGGAAPSDEPIVRHFTQVWPLLGCQLLGSCGFLRAARRRNWEQEGALNGICSCICS